MTSCSSNNLPCRSPHKQKVSCASKLLPGPDPMSEVTPIPNDPKELIPGKAMSLEEIDEVQRRKEAAIEIQKAYRE